VPTRADIAAGEIERRIVTGVYAPGAQLPNEAELAASVNVSRTTLREAVGRLAAKGLVTREQGRGTYVRAQSGVRISMLLEANLSVSDMIREMGLEPATTEVRVGIEVSPAHVSAAIGWREPASVLVVHRLRTADGVPAVFSDDYIVLAPGLPTAGPEYSGSLYELLARVHGRPVASGHARLSAGTATGDLARSLGLEEGGLTLVLSQVHQLGDGSIVMYSDAYLRNDVFTVHVRRGIPDRASPSPTSGPPRPSRRIGAKEVGIGSTS
jgi:DNA-binding GntR family transcriptional regulator